MATMTDDGILYDFELPLSRADMMLMGKPVPDEDSVVQSLGWMMNRGFEPEVIFDCILQWDARNQFAI